MAVNAERLHPQLAALAQAYEEGDDDWARRGGVCDEYIVGSSVRVHVFCAPHADGAVLRERLERYGGERVRDVDGGFWYAEVPVRYLIDLASDPLIVVVQVAVSTHRFG